MPNCYACGKVLNEWLESETGLKFCSEECFKEKLWPKCTTCGKPMNGGFTDQAGRPYCSDDCFSTTLPTCSCCGKRMQEWITCDDGRKYCSERCSESSWPQCCTCKKPMSEWLTDEAGKKYCSENCFAETFPTCDCCGKKMREWTTWEDGRRYCSEKCSEKSWPRCSVCAKPMRESIADEKGKQYCSEDCFSTTFPTCDICGKKTKEWIAYEDGHKYCSQQCAMQAWPQCVVCGKRIDSWQETEDGRKFCSETCLSTTWPKCDVCGKPMQYWSETPDGKKFCSTQCAETVLPTCDCCGIPMHEWYENELGKYCSDLCASTERKCKEVAKEVQVGTSAAGAAANAYLYADNVVLSAERGHGFAAEKANDLLDKVSGRDAKIVGGDNARNGADRLVDGVEIQTKYCRTGSKCVEECFEEGRFRYIDSSGRPMQIEVPSDKYDAAVQAMKNRISKGQIPGVSDPAEAEKIIRKGGFTYEQARNIAKFGTLESLTYDIANGAVVAAGAMGLSASLSFVQAIWSGADAESALKQACSAGLQVGGVVWVSGVLANQLGRTGLEAALRGTSDAVVSQLGPKASALIANSLRSSATPIAGQAALNSASKILRGNLVTSIATTVVLSSVDIYRMFDGSISGKQLFKNVTTTAANVGGGTAGWLAAGLALRWFFGPVGFIAGTIIGTAGAVVGGSMGGRAAKALLDQFIEDDAVQMFRIFKEVLSEQASSFMLTEAEVGRVSGRVNDLDMADHMREMYASSNRRAYAVSVVKPILVRTVASRPAVSLPNAQQLMEGTRYLLEPLAA